MSITELLVSTELGLLYSIAALGVYITFRIVHIQDLTCDGSFVLGAATSTMLLLYGYSPIIALSGALITGALAGLTTGILALYCNVSEILSGILVAFMLYSVNFFIMGGIPNRVIPLETTIFKTALPNIGILLILTGTIYLAFTFILTTEWGLVLRSIGFNKHFPRLIGFNTNKISCIALASSNALVSLSGAAISQYQGFADVSQGLGTLIVSLAAIIIGERLIIGKSLWVATGACIVGSVIYRIIIALALHSDVIGLPSYTLNLVTGIIIIAIIIGASNAKI